jgi:hypothetical protein
MDLYIKLFDVLFPVFFVIGVGYYIGVKDPNFDTKFITNFAGNIGTPSIDFLYYNYNWRYFECIYRKFYFCLYLLSEDFLY